MSHKYKVLIFDFDGTIADSMGVLLQAYATLSETMGFRTLSDTDVDAVRNMPPLKVLSYLGIPLYRLPQLIIKGRAAYNSLLSSVEPIPGIPFVLMELQKEYELHILTSNDQKIVLSFLDTHEISCFESVTSERNLFGKDKSLKKMFKQLQCSPEDALYIGDEVRDIQACQKVGVDICSVSWGLNSHAILAEHSPTYLLKDPKELLSLLI